MTAATIAPIAAGFEQGSETWATFRLQAPLALGEGNTWSMRYRERFSRFFEDRILYQYAVGAEHRLPSGVRVGLGYELFRTSFGISENRLFPQLQLRSTFAGLPLRHRFRLELRDLTEQELGFRDDLAYRFRYLIAHRRPIFSGGAYLELRNELFLTVGEGSALDPRLSQNRFGATFGRPLGERLRAEVRYQYGYSRGDELTRGDHLLQFQLDWDLR
ncbi:MAG: DUF2490 domain-containing protein [Pseudomonadota bacterium]